MSNDLAQRLRHAASQGFDIYDIHCRIELEAADEIDLLRHALAQIQNHEEVQEGISWQIAKDALAGIAYTGPGSSLDL